MRTGLPPLSLIVLRGLAATALAAGLTAGPVWAGQGEGPAPVPLRIIGSGTGCIAGASLLLPQVPGYGVIRMPISSY